MTPCLMLYCCITLLYYTDTQEQQCKKTRTPNPGTIQQRTLPLHGSPPLNKCHHSLRANAHANPPANPLRRRSTSVTAPCSEGSTWTPHHSTISLSPSCQPVVCTHVGPDVHQNSVKRAFRSAADNEEGRGRSGGGGGGGRCLADATIIIITLHGYLTMIEIESIQEEGRAQSFTNETSMKRERAQQPLCDYKARQGTFSEGMHQGTRFFSLVLQTTTAVQVLGVFLRRNAARRLGSAAPSLTRHTHRHPNTQHADTVHGTHSENLPHPLPPSASPSHLNPPRLLKRS